MARWEVQMYSEINEMSQKAFKWVATKNRDLGFLE